MSKRICMAALVAVVWASGPLPGQADQVNLAGDTAASTSNLGNFTGTLAYTDSSASSATLTVTLANTTPPALGGYLTSFVLNSPNNDITGITFSDTKGTFQLLGASSNFNDGINAMPFEYFDFGASINNQFEGSGAPQTGVAIGASDTFTFNLTGHHLDQLNAGSFVSELSDGSKGGTPEFFVARFTGFNNGGSDKVPGSDPPDPPTTPAPSGWMLGGLGTCLAWLARRVRRIALPL